MDKDKCRRCGMCCYVATCAYGEEGPRGHWGRCGYLQVNNDFTTTCTHPSALRQYGGLGCALTKTRKMHDDYYGKNLDEFKTTYLKKKEN